MASPLPSASSPPSLSASLPSSSSNPPANKRRISALPPGSPSISTNFQPNKKAKIGSPAPPGSASASRKNSFAAPKSSHPLRQTSFPPDEAIAAAAARSRRSPSVSSNATTSFTRGNSVDRVLVPVNTGPAGAGEEDGDDDEDDGKDDYGTTMLSLGNEGTEQEEADKKEHNKRLSKLLDQFDDDQMQRYETFRRANLNKPSVKKVANQVLNQSITANVATVISGFSKVFAGELIERAREIQAQWGDNIPGAPLMPEHIREASRRWRLENGKASGDPIAAMWSGERPRTQGATGTRIFR